MNKTNDNMSLRVRLGGRGNLNDFAWLLDCFGRYSSSQRLIYLFAVTPL